MVVLVGFKDECVKLNDELDFTVNKIGGLPDLMTNFDGNLYPKCKLCGNLLYQIVQVYCPLAGSNYHKTLHIFGCNNKGCWNKPESFTLLRCQKLEGKVQSKKTEVSTDSWGTNEWFDGDDYAAADAEYVKEESSTISDENSTSEMSVDVLANSLSKHLLLTDGVVSPPPALLSYYVYVMDEKDITMENSTDYEMQLYQEYITREGDLQNFSDAAGRKSGKRNGNKKKDDQQEQFGDGYEKVKLKHGDQMFYQFQKRIQHSPEQCLRYEWKGDPLILSNVSQIIPPIAETPPCSNCHAPRVFEMQLMPNLVTCLHERSDVNQNKHSSNTGSANGSEENMDDISTSRLNFSNVSDDTVIDFGCLYIYTCSRSCWKVGDVIVEEHIAFQPDPESSLLL